MEIVPTNITVADYCEAMDRNEIQVNRDYQRSDKVWPPAARSFLIETVLLGFPMPKLSLYQKTDVKSRKVYKEIVDGQQRSSALVDFYRGNFELHASVETGTLAGRRYADLAPEQQEKFLSYPLGIDLFVAATPEEIREVFRRINSYNVPLNPEEQRHASYQGAFKWFIHRLSRKFDRQFAEMGVFSTKHIVRMADAKLLTELCHALLNGIETTKRKQLDNMYSEHDDVFADERQLDGRLTDAVRHLSEWTEIHGSSLMKAYIFYSMILAVTHVERRVPALEEPFPSPNLRTLDKDRVVSNLVTLAEVLATDEPARRFIPFVAACAGKTNVKEQRITRFQWFCRALTSPRL